jgi:hypothetical protein
MHTDPDVPAPRSQKCHFRIWRRFAATLRDRNGHASTAGLTVSEFGAGDGPEGFEALVDRPELVV